MTNNAITKMTLASLILESAAYHQKPTREDEEAKRTSLESSLYIEHMNSIVQKIRETTRMGRTKCEVRGCGLLFIECHKLYKTINMTTLGYDDPEWFCHHIQCNVNHRIEDTLSAVVRVEQVENSTYKLDWTPRYLPKLRGLVRFIIVCSRYRNDCYAPGVTGALQAESDFANKI